MKRLQIIFITIVSVVFSAKAQIQTSFYSCQFGEPYSQVLLKLNKMGVVLSENPSNSFVLFKNPYFGGREWDAVGFWFYMGKLNKVEFEKDYVNFEDYGELKKVLDARYGWCRINAKDNEVQYDDGRTNCRLRLVSATHGRAGDTPFYMLLISYIANGDL